MATGSLFAAPTEGPIPLTVTFTATGVYPGGTSTDHAWIIGRVVGGFPSSVGFTPVIYQMGVWNLTPSPPYGDPTASTMSAAFSTTEPMTIGLFAVTFPSSFVLIDTVEIAPSPGEQDPVDPVLWGTSFMNSVRAEHPGIITTEPTQSDPFPIFYVPADTYTFSAGSQDFVSFAPPEGVELIHVELYGASERPPVSRVPAQPDPVALGAKVTYDLVVSPGDSYVIAVGTHGGTSEGYDGGTRYDLYDAQESLETSPPVTYWLPSSTGGGLTGMWLASDWVEPEDPPEPAGTDPEQDYTSTALGIAGGAGASIWDQDTGDLVVKGGDGGLVGGDGEGQSWFFDGWAGQTFISAFSGVGPFIWAGPTFTVTLHGGGGGISSSGGASAYLEPAFAPADDVEPGFPPPLNIWIQSPDHAAWVTNGNPWIAYANLVRLTNFADGVGRNFWGGVGHSVFRGTNMGGNGVYGGGAGGMAVVVDLAGVDDVPPVNLNTKDNGAHYLTLCCGGGGGSSAFGGTGVSNGVITDGEHTGQGMAVISWEAVGGFRETTVIGPASPRIVRRFPRRF